MRRDLAWPIHLADEGWRSEYREHRRHHGWLRDLALAVWLVFWLTLGLVLFFAIGSVQ